MKEVNFKDRVPTNPGRITLTPVPGATNTYTMERADNPTEEGTPLNKAVFNSIIHSRLTGRYYTPTVSRNLISGRTGLTANPLPTNGWVYATDETNRATSGSFVLQTSSNNGSSWLADRVFWSGGWQSAGGDSAWIEIYHAQAIKVKKMRFSVDLQYAGGFTRLEIQGSNDGSSWSVLHTITSVSTSATTYTLSDPGEYMYYRLYFINNDSNRVTVGSLSYAEYDINTYESAFTVSEGLPSSWTTEQRVMIATPAYINSFAVISNSLNGININTILQSAKRYELRYNGTAFDAKEV